MLRSNPIREKTAAAGLVLVLLSCPVFAAERFAFRRMYQGSFANDGGISAGISLGDYDNDGYLDVFVANWNNQKNFLYHNTRNGTFERITEGPPSEDTGFSSGPCWGDYNNDGFLDLFVANQRNQHNFLYRNNGKGSFTKVETGDIVHDYGDSYTGAWGDYDNDGFLDLFVANVGQPCFLYRNNGDETFSRINDPCISREKGRFWDGSWGDYDNDGYLDLFVADSSNRPNRLFHNNGDGTFTKIIEGPVVTDRGNSVSGSWADFDNDGDLDLFVANAGVDIQGQNDFLYVNRGDGTFQKVTEGPVVTSGRYSHGGVWGDFDLDGDLDLFVGIWGLLDHMFTNNGDGTFSREKEGSIVSQPGFVSCNPVAGDTDNDGDIEIFLANWENQNNIQYWNDSKSGRWIKIRASGTVSNRSAVGARIYVEARIGGRRIVQMREVKSNNGCRSQNGYESVFGLGDAESVDSIEIRWPSGRRDEVSALSTNQTVTLEEGKGIIKRDTPAPEAKISPLMAVYQTFQKEGIEAMLRYYSRLTQPSSDRYLCDDTVLLTIGNFFLNDLGQIQDAIRVLSFNSEMYPESAPTYAALGSAFNRSGNPDRAREYLNKALELIDKNEALSGLERDELLNGIQFELKNLEKKCPYS